MIGSGVPSGRQCRARWTTVAQAGRARAEPAPNTGRKTPFSPTNGTHMSPPSPPRERTGNTTTASPAPSQYPVNDGSQVLSCGTKARTSSTSTQASVKGSTFATICSTVMPLMPEATNRFSPSGGV